MDQDRPHEGSTTHTVRFTGIPKRARAWLKSAPFLRTYTKELIVDSDCIGLESEKNGGRCRPPGRRSTAKTAKMPKLRRTSLKRLGVVAALAGGLLLAGCEGAVAPIDDPNTPEPGQSNRGYNEAEGSIFGGDGDGIDIFGLFGSGSKSGGGGGGGGIGVNSYLWRATLDTISFMPLASADPFGGVIITDWYTPPESPAERFKMNVYILDRQLRADGVRVAVFRQNRDNRGWSDAGVTKETAVNLENEILTRARQLRFAARIDVNK